MKKLADIITWIVAVEHVGIMVLEMFFWDHQVGRRIFGLTEEASASSAVLAANQGLYNLFLAAGLFWGLVTDKREVKLFFLACVAAAGIFGGLSAKASILITQALPAFAALTLLMLSTEKIREHNDK